MRNEKTSFRWSSSGQSNGISGSEFSGRLDLRPAGTQQISEKTEKAEKAEDD